MDLMSMLVRRLSVCLVFLAAASANAQGILWTPARTNTIAWYDASDLSTISTNDAFNAVSQWNDKSRNGNHVTQGNTSKQPATGTRTISGLNAIDFDGSRELIDYTFSNIDTTGISVYSVLRFDTTFAQMTAWGIERTDADTGRFHHTIYNERFEVGYSLPENLHVDRAPTTVTPEFHAYIKPSTTVQNYWANGTLAGKRTAEVTSFTTQQMNLGSRDGGRYFNGAIAEIIVVDNAASAPERQQMEGYLAWKWGLQGNLPAGHPYKSNPPYASLSGTVLIFR